MFITRQLRRLKWVINNYRFISTNSKLLSTHFLGPITYDTDSLCTSINCDFIKEKKFSEAYEAAKATNPWQGFTLQWRVYIVCWFANHVKKLKGDFVECGVNTGAYSRAVVEYVDFNKLDKTFYLFDTFSGLREDLVTEQEKKMGIDDYFGKYKDVYQQVVETFKAFPVKIVQGAVPDTLSECDSQQIAYLSIDMNSVVPEIGAMEYFWPKMVQGGVIILDDYGFNKHINQKLAFDKFAEREQVQILALPTGQGIIFKP
jgi:O-methyltransferase